MAWRCNCHDCLRCVRAAERKARRLLYSHLTRLQKRTLLGKPKRITVIGNKTGDAYHIAAENSWVTRVRDGAGFCLALWDDNDDDATPVADCILAKKILIEADETLFLTVANETAD